MRRGDRGATILEYAALLTFVAGIATTVMVATDIPEQVGQGFRSAVCQILQRPGCEEVTPAAADPSSVNENPDVVDPVADDQAAGTDTGGNPVGDFLSGGTGRVADAIGTVGCMLHLCDGEDFEQSWGNVARTVTNPRVEDIERCADLRQSAPGTPSTRADGSPRQEVRIGHFNMAGNSENEGGTEVVDAIVRSVEDRQPAALTLNEACGNQMEDLQNKLPDGYVVHFSPIRRNDPETGSSVTCDDADESEYGNAVVYREDFLGEKGEGVRRESHDLGTPDREELNEEKRGMSCVSSDRTRTVVCSAHLTNEKDCRPLWFSGPHCSWSKDARDAEAEEAARILEEEYPGYSVVLGGDLNASPGSDTLDPLYDESYGDGASGSLKETDSADEFGGTDVLGLSCRGGESTRSGKKIDYVFVSDDVGIQWSDSTQSDYSDHDPLWADVIL